MWKKVIKKYNNTIPKSAKASYNIPERVWAKKEGI